MANCAAFAMAPHMLNPSSNPGIILLFMVVPLLWSRYSESFVTRARRTRRPVRSFDDSIMPVMEAVCSPLIGPAFRACNQRAFATTSKVALSVSVRAPLSVSSATRRMPGFPPSSDSREVRSRKRVPSSLLVFLIRSGLTNPRSPHLDRSAGSINGRGCSQIMVGCQASYRWAISFGSCRCLMTFTSQCRDKT
jgi:hypothetical protein